MTMKQLKRKYREEYNNAAPSFKKFVRLCFDGAFPGCNLLLGDITPKMKKILGLK